jgi:hypothetical protein
MLTKTDIAAIRRADDICIHLNSRNPQGLVRLIKRKGYDAKPFETDQEYVLETAQVRMECGEWQSHYEFFAMAGIYHSQAAPVSSILKTLKAGDEITFSFWPDCHSQAYVAAAGLHADCLYLHVVSNGKRRSFEFAHSICPANSARMCRGVPKSKDYDRAAEEGRKIA